MKKLLFMSLVSIALLAGCGWRNCNKSCAPVCKDEVCCETKRSCTTTKEVGWTEGDYK